MSIAVEGLVGDEVVRPQLELIAGGAGQVAATETVEAPSDSYKWEATYGTDGKISGARSWRYDAETTESTFTRFDAEGNELGSLIKNEAMGLTLEYEGANLVFASQVSNGGKNIERTWYGANREPKSTVQIDIAANTHTMIIHQPGIGDWMNTTPYRGVDGWTQ